MTKQRTWLSQWPDQTNLETNNPFVSDAFLTAVEASGACHRQSGWQPNHLSLGTNIVVPAYLKSHSWGEYVFDWSWAQAYQEHGLTYYPKLIIAAPYTPSQGPRLLGASSASDAASIVDAFKEKCHQDQLSGFHILFPNRTEQSWLDPQRLLQRSDIQFHWQNQNYRDFDDFLTRFSSRKRKNVRKERQSIAEQGIEMQVLTHENITHQHWDAFYQFYHATYLKRGRQGYLNRNFFTALRQSMPDNLVLIMAVKQEAPIAGALFFKDKFTLYGRYWGCIDHYPNLHFETCYYQGIDYCIRHGLQHFDPGTQGEHKIARGFEPTLTHSYHWLTNQDFHQAAGRFCEQERQLNQQYFLQASAALPFKKQGA